MNDPRTDTTRHSFSRREWLMLIAIMLLIEAWILDIGYEFRAQREVVDFVSFAATIASLLLAVIAIIYGFYQSDGQQKSAAAIASQIDAMRGVQGELNSASSGLSEQVKGIASTATMLRSLGETIEATHKRMANIEGGLSGLAEDQRTVKDVLKKMLEKDVALTEKQSPAQAAKSSLDKKSIAELLFYKSSPTADRLGVALDQLVKKSSGTFPDWIAFIEKHYEKPLGALEGNEKKADFGHHWFVGIELLAVARGLGLVDIDIRSKGGEQTLRVKEEIYETLSECAIKTAGSKSSGKAAEKIIESFSQQ